MLGQFLGGWVPRWDVSYAEKWPFREQRSSNWSEEWTKLSDPASSSIPLLPCDNRPHVPCDTDATWLTVCLLIVVFSWSRLGHQDLIAQDLDLLCLRRMTSDEGFLLKYCIGAIIVHTFSLRYPPQAFVINSIRNVLMLNVTFLGCHCYLKGFQNPWNLLSDQALFALLYVFWSLLQNWKCLGLWNQYYNSPLQFNLPSSQNTRPNFLESFRSALLESFQNRLWIPWNREASQTIR